MKTKKQVLSDQHGGSSILVAIVTSLATGSLIAYFYSDLNQTREAKKRISFSEGLDTVNLDVVQRLSQLIQSERLKVASDGKFVWDLTDNVNANWLPTGVTSSNEITFKNCNYEALPVQSQTTLATTKSSQYDAIENQLCGNYWVSTKVKVEDITTTGTDEFATISIGSGAHFLGTDINSTMSAKVQLGKSGGSVATPNTCSWEDPTYRASFWVAGGRHMAGWTVLGKGVNVKHKEIFGHTSSEWRSDVPSGKHYRGNTATHTVKGQRYILGRYEYFAWVYTPKTGSAGECFLALAGVRHNCWGCGCFTENTKIKMADGSEKEASKIAIGDMVWNPVRNNSFRVSKTTFGKEYEPLVKMALGKREITVTSLHPFMTRNGLKQAKHLTAADEIVEYDGSFHPVSSVQFQDPGSDTWVYNFALDTESGDPDDHMVLADGVVTGDRFLQDQLSRNELTRTAKGFNLYETKKAYWAEYRPGF